MLKPTTLKLSLLAGVAAFSLTSAHAVNAAGFFIQEQSVSAGGAAFAGAASNTKDASTLFFNPAGMTRLSGAQGNIGVQLLIPSTELTDTGSTATGNDGGNPYRPTPVPSGFAVMPVSGVDGLWVGIGVTAPFGLANKYDTGFFGRFDSTKTELLTTDIQPSVAYKVNDWLSIGGGVNIQRADAELVSAITVAGLEGTSKLEGDDWGYGYTLGTQIMIIPETTLAVNYRSTIHYNLDGEVTIADTFGPLNGVRAAKADLNTPDILSFGLSHSLNDKWTLMGQANWYGWNNFDNVTPVPDTGAAIAGTEQNYQTVWAYAVGAEYAYSPDWTFRGGIQYDNTPTVDEFRTTRTPDGDRTWFSGGATYNFAPNMSIDMNATYIHIADEEINVLRTSNAPAQRVSADIEGGVGIVGLAFNYKF